MGLTDRLATIAEIARHPASRGRRSLALLRYLRWNFGHRALGVEYVLPLVGGARLILSQRHNYATLVYSCGLWDYAEQSFLLHLLRPGDLFADIGSNVGGYSVLASAVAGANSVAFEPVPETYAELKRNIRLNDIEALVQAHCCALGETAGVNRMTSARGGLNHIVTGGDQAGTIEVQTGRLDDILAGRDCHLIKIDAEGFELSILRGARATLANPALQALIIELNGSGGRYGVSDDEVHAELTGYGFGPCRYDVETRTLTPLPSYNRDGLNTIYVRDPAALEGKLKEAVLF